MSLDDSGVVCEMASARSEMKWPAIQTVRQDRKVLLFYLAPAKFVIVPVRACSSEQVAQLRAMLKDNVNRASAK
jgi:hypothetical protein